MFNRIANCKNSFQKDFKKVLCLCSAGLLRSPTCAVVLSQEPYNFNTRAAGVEPEFALVPVDEVLIAWADEIVCVEKNVFDRLNARWDVIGKDITILEIPDHFEYRNPKLMELIRTQYDSAVEEEVKSTT